MDRKKGMSLLGLQRGNVTIRNDDVQQRTPLDWDIIQIGVRVATQGIVRHGSDMIPSLLLAAHAAQRPLTTPMLPVFWSPTRSPKGIDAKNTRVCVADQSLLLL